MYIAVSHYAQYCEYEYVCYYIHQVSRKAVGMVKVWTKRKFVGIFIPAFSCSGSKSLLDELYISLLGRDSIK